MTDKNTEELCVLVAVQSARGVTGEKEEKKEKERDEHAARFPNLDETTIPETLEEKNKYNGNRLM
uniref:Uncharacterized protein n=1 Tax=Arion vulgaris TaxID=1028688 RepID=A0A0B6Z054_9EUPU